MDLIGAFIFIVITTWVIFGFKITILVGFILLAFWFVALKPIYKGVRLILESIFEKLNKIEYLEDKIYEMYYYSNLFEDRQNRMIKGYIEYLIKQEKLPREVAENKAKFIISEFKHWEALSDWDCQSNDTPLFNEKPKYEYKFLKTKQFIDEISAYKPDEEEIYLNIRNLWTESDFKDAIRENRPDELILKENFGLGNPDLYWDYKKRKRVILALEELDIIKQTKQAELLRTKEGYYLRRREFKFTTFNLNEIEKILFRKKKKPGIFWLRKQLGIQENPRAIFSIESSKSYFHFICWWHWIEIDNSSEDYGY